MAGTQRHAFAAARARAIAKAQPHGGQAAAQGGQPQAVQSAAAAAQVAIQGGQPQAAAQGGQPQAAAQGGQPQAAAQGGQPQVVPVSSFGRAGGSIRTGLGALGSQLDKVHSKVESKIHMVGHNVGVKVEKGLVNVETELEEIGKRARLRMDAAGAGMYTFGKSSYVSSGKGIINVFKGMHQALPYRLIFFFLFIFVFYRIIYRICIFFGIDQIILSMYMGWFTFIIVLFTFLPYDYGNILDTQ